MRCDCYIIPEFDACGQATLTLSLLTRHGRATPLVWLTVDKATLKDRRNAYEYQALVRFADALPADIKVCVVADRGFGDHKLYRVLTEELAFDYVIRFRGTITVAAERYQVGTVICVRTARCSRRGAWPPAPPMRPPKL